MRFDGLTSFDEGTTFARFGELILKLHVRFNVEILDPCTRSNIELINPCLINKLQFGGIQVVGSEEEHARCCFAWRFGNPF